jgi:hypothetical protein
VSDPVFSDADVGSTVECCRDGAFGAPKPKKWTVDCVKKILCKSDPSVVKDNLQTVDSTQWKCP